MRTLKRRIKEECFKMFTKGRRVLILRESLDAWIGDESTEQEPLRLHPDDIEAIAAAVAKKLRAT